MLLAVFRISGRLENKDLDDVVAGLENGEISEDEEHVRYPDVKDLIKQFKNNYDDNHDQDNEDLPLATCCSLEASM